MDFENPKKSVELNHKKCIFCDLIANNKEKLLYEDELIAIFKDKKPKSRIHLLACPKVHIKNVNYLTPNHLDLLNHMEEKAISLLKNDPFNLTTFNFGFHVPPLYSVTHLHMHCLSSIDTFFNKHFMRSLEKQKEILNSNIKK